MSFFFDGFEDYILKEKSTEPDGDGGYIVTWHDGPTVKANFSLGGASETRVAMSQGLKAVFSASFPINTPVEYNSYLQAVKGGEIFRITSNPHDNQAPKEARFQTCYATAERTELPT